MWWTRRTEKIKADKFVECMVYKRDTSAGTPTLDELMDIMLIINSDPPLTHDVEIPPGFGGITETQYLRLPPNLQRFFQAEKVSLKVEGKWL